MPEVILTGASGRIEGRYSPGKKENAPIALILHPHPKAQGHMNNPVAVQLFHLFMKRGFATLNDVPASEALLLGNLLLAAQAYAKSIGIADDGYRVVMNCNRNGGQTVFHIHMHLLGGAPLTGGFA